MSFCNAITSRLNSAYQMLPSPKQALVSAVTIAAPYTILPSTLASLINTHITIPRLSLNSKMKNIMCHLAYFHTAYSIHPYWASFVLGNKVASLCFPDIARIGRLGFVLLSFSLPENLLIPTMVGCSFLAPTEME